MSNQAGSSSEANFSKHHLSNEIYQDSELHKNLGQHIIFVTEDKLRLAIRDYKNSFNEWGSWMTPLSLLITFLLVFATSTFRDALGISAEVWQALFMLATVADTGWLIRSLWDRFNNPPMSRDDFIDRVKRASEETKSVVQEHDD